MLFWPCHFLHCSITLNFQTFMCMSRVMIAPMHARKHTYTHIHRDAYSQSHPHSRYQQVLCFREIDG